MRIGLILTKLIIKKKTKVILKKLNTVFLPNGNMNLEPF